MKRYRRVSAAGAGAHTGVPGTYIVNEAVDRNRLRHQRMCSNVFHVIQHGLRLIFNRQPIDVFARMGARPRPMSRMRADQIHQMDGNDSTCWFAPIVADGSGPMAGRSIQLGTYGWACEGGESS